MWTIHKCRKEKNLILLPLGQPFLIFYCTCALTFLYMHFLHTWNCTKHNTIWKQKHTLPINSVNAFIVKIAISIFLIIRMINVEN